jgi:hypothetical protein
MKLPPTRNTSPTHNTTARASLFLRESQVEVLALVRSFPMDHHLSSSPPLPFQHQNTSYSMDITTEAIRNAAHEASIIDGVLVAPTLSSSLDLETSSSLRSPPNKNHQQHQQNLRRGKWTPEEEAYVSRLIEEFRSGTLPIPNGITLRTFLSKLLNCDPMRISKKFVGNNCIGKVWMIIHWTSCHSFYLSKSIVAWSMFWMKHK